MIKCTDKRLNPRDARHRAWKYRWRWIINARRLPTTATASWRDKFRKRAIPATALAALAGATAFVMFEHPTISKAMDGETGGFKVHKTLSLSTSSEPENPFASALGFAFGAVVALAWSPDGERLAAASAYGGRLTVWDRSGRKVVQIIRYGGGPTLGGSITFLQGSSKLVFPPAGDARSDAAVTVWDVASGKVLRSPAGPEPGGDRARNRAYHFAASPDQTRLTTATSAGGPWRTYRVNLWTYDTRNWRLTNTARIEDGVNSLAYFDGGRLIAVGSSPGRISVLDAASARLLHHFQAYDLSNLGGFDIDAIVGSPDGRWIMASVGAGYIGGPAAATPAGGAQAAAWEKSLEPVRMLRASDGARMAALTAPTTPIRRAAWDPKGRYVAFLDYAGKLFLWRYPFSPRSYEKIDLGANNTLALAISPDGDHIAVPATNGVSVYTLDPTSR